MWKRGPVVSESALTPTFQIDDGGDAVRADVVRQYQADLADRIADQQQCRTVAQRGASGNHLLEHRLGLQIRRWGQQGQIVERALAVK